MSKKPNLPQPTEAELRILQVLWEAGPSTVRFVNEQLNEQQEKEIKYTTTLKLMQIMTEKKLLSRNTETRTHVYLAEAVQDDTQKALLKKFVDATFQGSATNLVMQALGNHQTSQEELDEIKALIEKIEEKRSARLRYEVACGAMFTMLIMAVITFIIYVDQHPNIAEVTAVLTSNHSSSPVIITNIEPNFLQANFQSVVSFFDQQLLQVMESALVKVPILLGHLKPLILIPVGTINLLSEEEVEAILAHELAHIIRRDFSLNIFFTLVEILFYYHPGVWLMAATIRSERENCCDDLALFLCKKPLAYARALYKLEAAHQEARLPGLALSFSSKKKQLLHRVRRILNQPQNKSNIMEKLVTTTLLFLTITILSVGAKMDEQLK